MRPPSMKSKKSNQNSKVSDSSMNQNAKKPKFCNRNFMIHSTATKNQDNRRSNSKGEEQITSLNCWVAMGTDNIRFICNFQRMNITLSEDKENINPNIMASNCSDYSWTKMSREPKVSKFKSYDKEWRKRIMLPSKRQVEIEQKLSNMLSHQMCFKQILPTALSEQRLMTSFASIGNLTLQKYYQEKSRNDNKKNNLKDQLIEIVQLLPDLALKQGCKIQSLSEEELAEMIKKNVKMLLNRGISQQN